MYREVITTRDDLHRWVQDAWGDDDEPGTLPQRQRAAGDVIRDEAYRAGIRYGEDWGGLLASLPEDWRWRTQDEG